MYTSYIVYILCSFALSRHDKKPAALSFIEAQREIFRTLLSTNAFETARLQGDSPAASGLFAGESVRMISSSEVRDMLRSMTWRWRDACGKDVDDVDRR